MIKKEDCERALENMHCPIVNTMTEEMAYETLKRLIDEHFDEKGNVKAIANIFINGDEMKQLVDKAVDEFFDPEPYKFEDLKPDMWVCDDKTKEVCYIEFIDKISSNNGLIKILWIEYLKSHVNGEYMCQTKFEENRFYPVTKAMCQEVKDD